MRPEVLFKILSTDGTPCNGGTGRWYLPKGKRPAKWMSTLTDLVPCHHGYHLVRAGDLLSWYVPGRRVFIAEYRGERINYEEKVVVAGARLVREVEDMNRLLRLYACDCAERAMKRAKWKDKRSWQALEVARKFASGQASEGERLAAAAAAAAAAKAFTASAAAAAYSAAAYSTAYSAAAYSAWHAAYSAAWSAVESAAAGDMAAERRWQARRLEDYLLGRRK